MRVGGAAQVRDEKRRQPVHLGELPAEAECPYQATSSPARRAFGGIHTPTMKQPTSMLIFPHQQAEESPHQQHVVSYNPKARAASTTTPQQGAQTYRKPTPTIGCRPVVALSEFRAKEVESLLQFLATMDRRPDEKPISTASNKSTQNSRKQRHKTLTSAEQDEICRLYTTGAPMLTICSKFNISRATVHRIWRSRGLPPRQRGLNEAQKDEAKILYLEDKSLATLGKLFDVSPSTVRDCLLRQGVVLRGSS